MMVGPGLTVVMPGIVSGIRMGHGEQQRLAAAAAAWLSIIIGGREEAMEMRNLIVTFPDKVEGLPLPGQSHISRTSLIAIA